MYRACGMHSSLNRQILVFIVYHQHSPRRKLSTLSPKTYHSAHRVFYFNFSLTVNALQVSCHATSVYQLSHWQPLFCFPFLLPGRYRDLRRNISLRLVRQRAADCEREHFITEHKPHTMLCHVRGASDNVQQTTCNNFFISSPRLFDFSFLYVICGTWELYLYNFPWFDTTKLCSCASQLDFSPLFRSSSELLMTHLLLGVRGDHLVISPYHINTF